MDNITKYLLKKLIKNTKRYFSTNMWIKTCTFKNTNIFAAKGQKDLLTYKYVNLICIFFLCEYFMHKFYIKTLNI